MGTHFVRRSAVQPERADLDEESSKPRGQVVPSRRRWGFRTFCGANASAASRTTGPRALWRLAYGNRGEEVEWR
jgi:hypothetical protein